MIDLRKVLEEVADASDFAMANHQDHGLMFDLMDTINVRATRALADEPVIRPFRRSDYYESPPQFSSEPDPGPEPDGRGSDD